MARNSYTRAIADRIVDLIADGSSLASIAAMPGMPARRTVRQWIDTKPEFAARYDAARLQWVDSIAEEINTLADSAPRVAAEAGEFGNAAVQALRTQIDTKKWLLARIAPSRFGDRLTTEITGRDGKDLVSEMDPDRMALAILNVLGAHPRPTSATPAPLIDQPPPEPARPKLVFDVRTGKLTGGLADKFGGDNDR